MGITERKVRKQEELKNEIIAQSWAIIEEEGWQALSIRRIADAIEYSVPVIYKHFENKEAILEHFVKAGFDALSVHIETAVNPADQAILQIQQIALAYWDFAAQRTKLYEIMFGLGIPNCETINSVSEMKRMSDFMLHSIEGVAQESGNLKVDKYLKLKSFWSTLHGYIAIELLSNSKVHLQPTATFMDAIESFIFTLIHKK